MIASFFYTVTSTFLGHILPAFYMQHFLCVVFRRYIKSSLSVSSSEGLSCIVTHPSIFSILSGFPFSCGRIPVHSSYRLGWNVGKKLFSKILRTQLFSHSHTHTPQVQHKFVAISWHLQMYFIYSNARQIFFLKLSNYICKVVLNTHMKHQTGLHQTRLF